MSWVSPRMSSTSFSNSTSAPASASASSSSSSSSTASKPPETPASVPDLHPALCRDIIHFRHLLARYRALDDQITSTLNRTLASSRDAGRNLPPSLLLPSSLPLLPSSSSSHSPLLQSHADAGTTTYARADSASCAALWDQLVRVWSGREESVRYCLSITGASPTRVATQGAAPSFSPVDEEDDELARLDADRRLGSGAVSEGRRPRKTRDRDAERAPDRWRGADEETWRGTREAEEDALRRQLHNELVVDQILRRRSTEVFRSRCPGFVPPHPQSTIPTASSAAAQDLVEHSWRYWTDK